MPLDFPSSPTNGQVYSLGSKRWVWNSANNTWDAASVSYAILQRYRYLATAGQTSISGADADGKTLAYIAGIEQVYLNGVLLVRGQDYTATNGTSITGLAALALNDSVEIVSFGVFALTDAVNQSVIDTLSDESQILMVMGIR